VYILLPLMLLLQLLLSPSIFCSRSCS
jgi:hypothetical protein